MQEKHRRAQVSACFNWCWIWSRSDFVKGIYVRSASKCREIQKHKPLYSTDECMLKRFATGAFPKKLEAREPWKRETFAQRRHLMCCMRLCKLQANMDSRPIFCFLCWSWWATNRDEGEFYKWRNNRNPRFQTQRRETVVMIPACPDCPGVVMRQSLSQ